MNMQISTFDNLSAIIGSFDALSRKKRMEKKKSYYFSKYFHCKEIKYQQISPEMAHGYSVTWLNLLKREHFYQKGKEYEGTLLKAASK